MSYVEKLKKTSLLYTIFFNHYLCCFYLNRVNFQSFEFEEMDFFIIFSVH